MSGSPSIAEDGAQLFASALPPEELGLFRKAVNAAVEDGPGGRLSGDARVASALETGTLSEIAKGLIGPEARPVRALAFDKSSRSNWALSWHQDRTIFVRRREDVEGYGPWSTKRGLVHVTPPAELLAGMVTLRAHLDPCGEDNAPLLAASGSHRLGRIAAEDAAAIAAKSERVVCLAKTGDVWAYSTLVLHASDRAIDIGRRRVLQVDYAAQDLPGGLEWRGVA